ncbi:MAG: AsmA family protein, partial [Bartonella sp.]|nr:AsmA family protein [Bartonella sp.]
QGVIAAAIIQERQKEFRLQAQLRKRNSSETLCRDIQCLTNSLAWPFAFSLSSKGQERGNFWIKKDIDAD